MSYKLFYSCLCCLACATAIVGGVYQPLSDICPYSNFCQSNAAGKLDHSTKIPCCLPCSCDHDCSMLGTCCTDIDLSGKDTPITTCKLTLVIGAEAADSTYDGISDGIRRYRIVDSCPKEEQNASLKDRCQGNKKESITDYIWVSDVDTGIIYKNVICALCNHVTSVIQWKTRISFDTVLLMNTTVTDFLTNFVDLTMEAPDNETERAELYRCFMPKYSTCNETGQWNDYDVTTEMGCKLHYTPFLQESPFSLKVYKNIFCFLCNVGNLNWVTTECRRYDGDRIVPTTSFSAVIDFTGKWEEIKSTDQSMCRADEVYDEYLGECYKLQCPYLSAPFRGHCESIVLETKGLVVSVNYILKFSDYNSFDLSNLYGNGMSEFGSLILDTFENTTDLLEPKCPLCVVKLYTPVNETVKFILTTMLYTTPACQLDSIYELIQKILGKEINLKGGGSSATLFFQLDKRTATEIQNLSTVAVKSRQKCTPQLQIFKETVCPEIEINIDVLKSNLGEKSNSFTSANNAHHMYNSNSTMTICWDDYLSAMNEIYSVQHSSQQKVQPVITNILMLGIFLVMTRLDCT